MAKVTKKIVPGTKDITAKKTKKAGKLQHPAVLALTKDARLDAAPADFNFDLHKPIKKRVFSCDAVFYEHKVAELQNKVVKMQKLASEAKILGTKTERGKVRKLMSYVEKMKTLKEMLVADGIDVDALMAAHGK